MKPIRPADERGQGLVERARSGDRDALAELLVRHLPGLRAYVCLHAGPRIRARESCSDLVQSVCREVLADLGEFEYRGEAAFRHWLYKRAFHKILRRHRYWTAQRRAVDREQMPGEATATDAELLAAYGPLCTPSRELMQREAIERIEAAFDELPEDYRTAIVLHRLVGLSHEQIAHELGRTPGAVRNLVYRGLAQLAVAVERRWLRRDSVDA